MLHRKSLVDRNKTSLALKILCMRIYNNNYVQNIQITIIKSDIKNAKPKSKLGLLKS
jgi:hypothetical protein